MSDRGERAFPRTPSRSGLLLPGRRTWLTGAAALAVTAGAGAGLSQQISAQQPTQQPGLRRPPPRVGPPQPIEVLGRPIGTFERGGGTRRNSGRLEFVGGLVLTSSSAEFGGWSGLVVSEDGRRLLAISDRGSWMLADIVAEGGRPRGLDNAILGEIAGLGGQSLRGRDKDAESVTLLEGTLARGTVLISFERNHRIGRFPVTDRGLGPPLGYLRMPPDARRMSSNKGLEAITVLRGGPLRGAIVAFAEELHDAARNHTGWIWPAGMASEPQRLGMTNIADFAITDAAALPDGSLIVLERKFRWLEGVRMRLRHLRAADIRPGALLEGEVLLEADMTSEIDNMEALALSRNARGQTVLTIMSDNNFNSMLQRSLLLQFTLVEATAGRAPARL